MNDFYLNTPKQPLGASEEFIYKCTGNLATLLREVKVNIRRKNCSFKSLLGTLHHNLLQAVEGVWTAKYAFEEMAGHPSFD